MGLLHTKQRQMGQWKAVASSRPERLARKQGRELNGPAVSRGRGTVLARTHCSLRINRIFSYWLFHLFLDPGSPAMEQGAGLHSKQGCGCSQERPDFS